MAPAYFLLLYFALVPLSHGAWTILGGLGSSITKLRYFRGILGYLDAATTANRCNFRRFDPQKRAFTDPIILKASNNGIVNTTNCRDFEFVMDSASNTVVLYTLENGWIRVRLQTDTNEFTEVPGSSLQAFTWGSVWIQSFIVDYYHRLLYVTSPSLVQRFDIANLTFPVLKTSANFVGNGGGPYVGTVTTKLLHVAAGQSGVLFNITGPQLTRSGNVKGLMASQDQLRSVFSTSNYVIYTTESSGSNTVTVVNGDTGDLVRSYSMDAVTGVTRTGFVIGGLARQSLFIASTRFSISRLVFFGVERNGELTNLGMSSSSGIDNQGFVWESDHVFVSGGSSIAYDTFSNVSSSANNLQSYFNGVTPPYGMLLNPLTMVVSSNRFVVTDVGKLRFTLNVWNTVANLTFIPINVLVTNTLPISMDLMLISGTTSISLNTGDIFPASIIASGSYFEITVYSAFSNREQCSIDFSAYDGRNGIANTSIIIDASAIYLPPVTSTTQTLTRRTLSTSSRTTTTVARRTSTLFTTRSSLEVTTVVPTDTRGDVTEYQKTMALVMYVSIGIGATVFITLSIFAIIFWRQRKAKAALQQAQFAYGGSSMSLADLSGPVQSSTSQFHIQTASMTNQVQRIHPKPFVELPVEPNNQTIYVMEEAAGIKRANRGTLIYDEAPTAPKVSNGVYAQRNNETIIYD